jgi:predicted Rossmann-fold nucleotide-binding protein
VRLLVCGGRDYANASKVNTTLSSYTIDVLICGCARGADTLAYNYAVRNRILLQLFPAKWDTYGKAAGFIRNQQMLDEGKPDLILAFPGGRGTADMCARGIAAKVEVIHVT